MIYLVMIILLVLYSLFQYYMLCDMKEEIKSEVSSKLDNYLSSIHFKSITEVNKFKDAYLRDQHIEIHKLIKEIDEIIDKNRNFDR